MDDQEMAHEILWQELNKLDRRQVAQRAGCRYLSDRERYIVPILNTDHVVDLENREIWPLEGSCPFPSSEFLLALSILTYLINAQDLPPRNRLVKPEALPTGQFFFRGLHSPPTEQLEKAFGQDPAQLRQVAARFGAKNREFGDTSVEVPLFPRIALTIAVWRGDDEFPARASILLDETAGEQLPLDALLAAINIAVDAITEPMGGGDSGTA